MQPADEGKRAAAEPPSPWSRTACSSASVSTMRYAPDALGRRVGEEGLREACKIVEENPKLEGARGEALRLLLNIFERAEAIRFWGGVEGGAQSAKKGRRHSLKPPEGRLCANYGHKLG